jgi:hypothetical protein
MKRAHLISAPAILAALLLAATASAQDYKPPYTAGPIQGPNLSGMDKATLSSRAKEVRINRGQGLKPAVRQEHVGRLAGMNMDTPEFQTAVSTAAPQVRAALFLQKATEANTPAASHTRRIRGLSFQDGRITATHASKQFVEVTNGNFDLFRKINGRNMVWFSVNDQPGHLHTLLADQAGGTNFTHNVYGVQNDAGGVTGNYTQYSAGVQLTDREMDRLARYMNAGNVAAGGQPYGSGKGTVFGFYNSKKQKITDIKCTNWVTSAPIGELPRWAATVDRRVTKMAEAGSLAAVPEIAAAGGLHGALAAATTPEARTEIAKRLLTTPGLTKWNKSAIKRMVKSMNKLAADFPARPTDLLLRTSLAETLGMNRSQDPAKWSFDLLNSKRVPVIAVLNGQPDANLPQKSLNWEIMGNIDPSGAVVANTYHDYSNPRTNQGVIPTERRIPTPKKVKPAPAAAQPAPATGEQPAAPAPTPTPAQ